VTGAASIDTHCACAACELSRRAEIVGADVCPDEMEAWHRFLTESDGWHPMSIKGVDTGHLAR